MAASSPPVCIVRRVNVRLSLVVELHTWIICEFHRYPFVPSTNDRAHHRHDRIQRELRREGGPGSLVGRRSRVRTVTNSQDDADQGQDGVYPGE
jgi:hypothetical protein